MNAPRGVSEKRTVSQSQIRIFQGSDLGLEVDIMNLVVIPNQKIDILRKVVVVFYIYIGATRIFILNYRVEW